MLKEQSIADIPAHILGVLSVSVAAGRARFSPGGGCENTAVPVWNPSNTHAEKQVQEGNGRGAARR